jgi:hypothetical protein
MAGLTKFTVTEDHLKLMRHFWVRWGEVEYGAPEIDSKRPYGNSDVVNDIAEILGWEVPGDDYDWDDPEYGELRARARKIHEETMTALQIALRVGYFKAGNYEKPNSYSEDWREV